MNSQVALPVLTPLAVTSESNTIPLVRSVRSSPGICRSNVRRLDVTTLPCGVGSSTTAGKYAPFRRTQPGFASGTGTITVIFTDNDDALGQRMLDNVMLSSQEGARVKLYVNQVDNGAGAADDPSSMYIECDISMESMSVSVNPDDPITADIGYSISNVTHLFKADLS